MLRQLSPWELGIWAALWEVNPWGELRADKRAAIGHSLFANANRDPKKYPQPFRDRDFMPYLEATPEERDRALGAEISSALGALPTIPAGEVKAWRSRKRRKQ